MSKNYTSVKYNIGPVSKTIQTILLVALAFIQLFPLIWLLEQ